MANTFREQSDQLSIQLTGMTLNQAVKAGTITIAHDALRALTQVTLRTADGPRTALVGGRSTLYRTLFVRIALGRLACARNTKYVVRTDALDGPFARSTFDTIRVFGAPMLHNGQSTVMAV